MFEEDEMLMLSGIQHYKFCPRQWALIHIEQQWADNRLTVEGHILHRNVDNPEYRTKNGDTITIRSLHLASKTLGLYGIADAVELIPADEEEPAFVHPHYPGRWRLLPVEYKHGHQKPDERDEVQLAAQSICLEEMYHVKIYQAAFFYWETRSRKYIEIGENIRKMTYECAQGMHDLYNKGTTPYGRNDSSCKRCSLIDICCPVLGSKTDVTKYLNRNLYENNA